MRCIICNMNTSGNLFCIFILLAGYITTDATYRCSRTLLLPVRNEILRLPLTLCASWEYKLNYKAVAPLMHWRCHRITLAVHL